MPIPVQNNSSYDVNLINQKYAPLAVNAVVLDNTVKQEYGNLFRGRIEQLKNQNLFPAPLRLYAADWNQIQTNETAAGALPPIVVVSSNRADWILESYNRIEYANFADVNDVEALREGPMPWYSPRRINDANRHVYILVHVTEYGYYQRRLGNTMMKVVGWSFESNVYINTDRGTPIKDTYVGFGASRFAAIEFCKYIFNQIIVGANNPRVAVANQKAWLVDDNVVYVNAFPGFGAVEAEMDNNIWGLGFTAAANTAPFPQAGFAAPLINANPAMLTAEGILQQCVLWNIGQLNARFLNFSPYFVNSNEDTSFSSFLRNQDQNRLRICPGARVVKGIPRNDAGVPSANISFLRNRAVQNFYNLEHDYRVIAPPNQGGGQHTLSEYVRNRILANPPQENPIFTEAKAVEQIMAKVIAEKFNWVVPPELKKRVFQPNGEAIYPTQHF
jgi:hypothetical protein